MAISIQKVTNEKFNLSVQNTKISSFIKWNIQNKCNDQDYIWHFMLENYLYDFKIDLFYLLFLEYFYIF